MKVYINDLEVDKSSINLNTGLNFGRFIYEGLVIDNYKIVIHVQEFIDVIEPDYNRIRDEIKIDDETQNETSEFTAINYGSIRDLLQNKQVFQDISSTYLVKILFSKLFVESNNAIYIINSTDLVSVKNNNIKISGKVYGRK